MKVHISTGNQKLGSIPNISFPPILACSKAAAKLCGRKCYAMKAWKQYPAVRKNWTENYRLWKEDRNKFIHQFRAWFLKHKPGYFRFMVGGDILDGNFLKLMVVVAEENPGTKFLAFTKRLDLLQGWNQYVVPPNLSLIVSRWPGDGLEDTIRRQAWVHDPSNLDTRIPADVYTCPGSCKTCKYCFHSGPAQDVLFHVH